VAESTSSVDIPRSRHWSSQRQLSDEVGECVLPASYGHSPTPLSGHLNVGFTVDSGPSLDDAIRRVSAGTVPIATHLEGKADRVSDGSVRGAQIVRHASAHIRHASLHAPQCSGA
jgi:hypothetical protein